MGFPFPAALPGSVRAADAEGERREVAWESGKAISGRAVCRVERTGEGLGHFTDSLLRSSAHSRFPDAPEESFGSRSPRASRVHSLRFLSPRTEINLCISEGLCFAGRKPRRFPPARFLPPELLRGGSSASQQPEACQRRKCSWRWVIRHYGRSPLPSSHLSAPRVAFPDGRGWVLCALFWLLLISPSCWRSPPPPPPPWESRPRLRLGAHSK